MDTSTLMASLVDSYKDLNMRFRNAADSPAAREIVRRMRDDEIQFSQALKDRLTGIGTDSGGEGQIDGEDATLAQLISQFGGARATTLNLLKGITSPSQWSNTGDDGISIEKHVSDLVESDRNQMAKLATVLGI